jgi:uncharacterized protein (TIGR02679 family)
MTSRFSIETRGDLVSTLQEAVAFFCQRPVYCLIFDAFVRRFQELGHWGGSISLPPLNPEEKDILQRFLAKTLQPQGRITYKDLQKALLQTRFSDIELSVLILAYHGGPIIPIRIQEEGHQKRREAFFQAFFARYPHPNCQIWIEEILRSPVSSRMVYQSYEEDPVRLEPMMVEVCEALRQLPCQPIERISLFAARITKDPHRFDLKQKTGKMLLHALRTIQKKTSASVEPSESKAEEINKLFFSFGLVRDDILNFISSIGVIGCDHEGQVFQTWKVAYQECHVLNPPLREIERVHCFQPVRGNQVRVVENSGVFSTLLSAFSPDPPPLICTHGEFNLSALMLLDKLIHPGIEIYYNGDFDPEGILMAQRLLYRYPNQLRLWRFDAEHYLFCLSPKEIESGRLKKLEHVQHPSLQELKQHLLHYQCAGYQELIADVLAEDIRR